MTADVNIKLKDIWIKSPNTIKGYSNKAYEVGSMLQFEVDEQVLHVDNIYINIYIINR